MKKWDIESLVNSRRHPECSRVDNFNGGLYWYINAKFGDWEIFKEVM